MATKYSNAANTNANAVTDDLLYQNFGATSLPGRGENLSMSPDGSNESFRRNGSASGSGSGSDSGEPRSPRASTLFDPEAELEMQAEAEGEGEIGRGHGEDELDECSSNSNYYDAQEYLSPEEQYDSWKWQAKYKVQCADEMNSASPSTSRASPKPLSKKSAVSKFRPFDKELSQSKRRQQMLEYQKTRRDDMLEKIRQLDEGESGFSESETEDGVDFLQVQNNKAKQMPQEVEMKSQSKKKQKKKRGVLRRAPTRLMLSEWFITKPEDFAEKWIGVLCPAGKRAIVVASRGRTKVYSLRDEYMGSFISLLPGGRKGIYSVRGSRGRGVTILDCIWSEMAQVFYVLDLICWNSHSCVNCDMEYRQFFLAAKFAENPELLSTSASNHIAFMPLPYFESENLPTILTSIYPPFPDLIDGIMFMHKETFYIAEVNPLVLWLRLADVDRRLGLAVNPELLGREAPPKVRKNGKQSNHMDCDNETTVTETELSH